jgi:hypothetical protein
VILSNCTPRRHGPRALRLLAGSPHGSTEAITLAHGFTAELLVDLVRDGLATAAPGIIYAGKRPIEVTQLRITDIGRQMLAGAWRAAGVARDAGGHRLPLVALMPQWRQDYPHDRPPTWATAISAVGQVRTPQPLFE